MGAAISEDLRWRIVYLFYDSHGIQEIAELLRLGTATVKRVIACYQKWKCVINSLKGLTGRRKIYNGTHMKVSSFIVYLFIVFYSFIF
jgi:transposase